MLGPETSTHSPAPRLVLGIETSCDDTAAALYDGERGLLAHRLYSQIDIHREFGGVVPELAARDHIQKLLPLVVAVMDAAGVSRAQLDGVAYTAGPGLAGALLVGAAVGRSLAWSLQVPAVGVHHMEGHLLAPMLEEPRPAFPFLALLVSGGHTLLADVTGPGRYRILGESLDDAVGEAFDKAAKLLGLSYPGGPAIAAAARGGDPGRFHFPRPMTDRPGLDFSFSGLKTYTLTTAREHELDARTVADSRIEYNADACKGCGKCLSVCPENAVSANVADIEASVAELTGRIDSLVDYRF